MTHASGSFKPTSWDEKPYDEAEDLKLTRATVTYAYEGDLDATGANEALMVYAGEKGEGATYVGLERLTGSLAGRPGSFVVEFRGTFADGVARGTWAIVPGSGRGDLTGITGTGGAESVSDPDKPFPWWLDYELPT